MRGREIRHDSPQQQEESVHVKGGGQLLSRSASRRGQPPHAPQPQQEEVHRLHQSQALRL